MSARRLGAAAALCIALLPAAAAAQVSQRGLVDLRGVYFPQTLVHDNKQELFDVLAREEVFVRPTGWLEFAAGLDFRMSNHRQVEDEWRLDWEDRGVLRPRLALRRLNASVSGGGLTLDVGKQFIRWGRADIVYPTDRFAPRDFLNVFDAELLPVIGARASYQFKSETLEAVWVPRFTPSRLPLVDQRWTVLPPGAEGIQVVDAGTRIPDDHQIGVRWRHSGNRIETAVSFFDGFNHLPNIDVAVTPDGSRATLTRWFPDIRMFGADAAIPTPWVTFKLESAYVTSPSETTEEYVLYVVEIERQVGEWVLDLGYAGDVVVESRPSFPFAPDRQVARSFIGRAAYTVDPNRTVALEGAARQNGDGFYGRFEFSQAVDRHSRLIISAVGIRGEADDFIGQYQRSSHATIGLRFTF